MDGSLDGWLANNVTVTVTVTCTILVWFLIIRQPVYLVLVPVHTSLHSSINPVECDTGCKRPLASQTIMRNTTIP
jgi:hypothetical protein